jgi:lathosterol oxidase
MAPSAATLADIGLLTSEDEKRAARIAHDEYVRSSLRPAKWSEVGPDIFFVGVNAIVALFCAALYYSGVYPSISECKELAYPWVARVFAVNWVVMFAGYEGYNWLFFKGGYEWLYSKPPTKFNPQGYEEGQLAREMSYTTLSMGIASLYHCGALYAWANGLVPSAYFSISEVPLWQFLGTFLALGLWSDFHFYWCHRGLHTSLLYAPFHKLHHASKNPGPWSGMSMHPVESILYLSKILGGLVCTHPLHFLFILFNATLMPIPGHSGHLEALGNEYHWIHHHVSVCVCVCV